MEEPFIAVPEGELASLASRLKDDLPVSASIYNTLVYHGRGHGRCYTFYTLKGHPQAHAVVWRDKDGAEYGVHCREEEVGVVSVAIGCSKVFEWRPEFEIAHIPEYLVAGLHQAGTRATSATLSETRCHMFAFNPDHPAHLAPLRVCAGLAVRVLGAAGVRHMLANSKFDKHRCVDATLALGRHTAAVGVYDDRSVQVETVVDPMDLPEGGEDEVPVAWTSLLFYGGIAMLRTEERYRRQGLGSLTMQVVARRLAARGYVPHGYVEHDNNLSYAMFNRLPGWHRAQAVSWLHSPLLPLQHSPLQQSQQQA